MTAQILDRTLESYRIGDPGGAYPIFDATGSTIFPGRWNSATSPMIYSSERYSTALLEKLAHGSGRLPPNQHYARIMIPAGIPYEYFDEARTPGWDTATPTVSRSFGDAWQRSKRSLILIVPSVLARIDCNILINPTHPDFRKIQAGLHKPVFWDKRLFL